MLTSRLHREYNNRLARARRHRQQEAAGDSQTALLGAGVTVMSYGGRHNSHILTNQQQTADGV